MTERLSSNLSLQQVRMEAIEIFRATDYYEDSEGRHPNTLRRSSRLAVEKVLIDRGLTPQSLYSALYHADAQDSFPRLRFWKKQGMTEEGIDRSIKRVIADSIQNKLKAVPEFSLEQDNRIREHGRL